MTDQADSVEVPVLVVSAPSGVGKTSLISKLVEEDPSIGVAVSHTTRPPRESERDGQHYHFVSQSKFSTLRENEAFVETAEIFGYLYGVSWCALDHARRHSELVILEVDWQGSRSIRARKIPSRSVFILPPTRQDQISRLRGRDQDSDEVIQRRIRQAYDDCKHYTEFNYQIVNDDFDTALSLLRRICDGTRKKRKVDLPDVKPVADRLLIDLKTGLR